MSNNQDHFNLLRKINSKPKSSQRELAEELRFSLGKLNYCLKSLKNKGLIKINNFISLKNNHDLKPRKVFYGRWFVNGAEIFSWYLFFPFVLVLVSFISCNESIMVKIIELKLKITFKIFYFFRIKLDKNVKEVF